jgi:branched-chain amino acid transport system ATP-binding protein
VSDVVLALDGLVAGYGAAAPVLRGVSLQVRRGEVVCLVGPNGAGKSTVLKVASGMLAPREGAVRLQGADVTAHPPHRLLHQGLAHVLQGHSVFPDMTVGENIRMGAYTLRDRAVLTERVERVRATFPVIAERWKTTAGLLSGGQQKMVEFGRALMLDPVVILLDEPSMGLDPKTTATVFSQIDRLREIGKAVLLVEQNARRALEMADRGCVLDLGSIHVEGPAQDLLADPSLGRLYLGGGPVATDGKDQQTAANGAGGPVGASTDVEGRPGAATDAGDAGPAATATSSENDT